MTPEQKKKVIDLLVQSLISLIVSLASIFGFNMAIAQPAQAAQAAALIAQVNALKTQMGVEPNSQANQPGALAVPYNVSALPMRCKNTGINCVEIWNGSDIKTYSNAGTTNTFSVDGATGDTLIGGTLRLGAASTISVTNNSIITPTKTYQPLQSAGTVTATAMATTGFSTGNVVTLINTSDTSIVLTNGTNLKLPGAANLTLGQYDSVELWNDGTRWIAIANENN
jgi:hypothetical protein